MAILNYTTKIPVSRTLAEIHKKLANAGAIGILTDYENKEPCGITFCMDTPHGKVYFKLPASIRGVSAALSRDKQYRDEPHAARVAWRILKDWIEAQLAIIEAGMAELSQVFLPYAQTKTGETVYEIASQRGITLLGGN
jgi:hypothetical protein